MAGLTGRISVGQFRTSSSRAQNPQHAVEDLARVAPGPSLPIGPPLRPVERPERHPLEIDDTDPLDVLRLS